MPSRPKVLFISPNLAHYRYDLFMALQQDHRLEVIFAADASRLAGIAGIPPSTLDRVELLRNRQVKGVLWQSGLMRSIRNNKPSIVVFTGDVRYLTTWIGALICKLTGRRTVFWTIGWHRPESGIKKLVRLAFYRLADRLMLYGNTGREIGIALGFPASKMRVVYNSSSLGRGVELSDPDDFSTRLPPFGRIIVTAIARITSVKRLDLLIEAAAKLRSEGVPVEILFVGDGPAAQEIQNLARQTGVPLHMPGPAYEEENLIEVYSRTAVSVVPSRAGLTTIQSLRHGVPVITHNNPFNQVPEYEAILPGVNGDLFEEGNSVSLAAVMKPFLALHEPGSRKALADACKASIKNQWDASSQARHIMEVLLDFT